MNKKHYRFSCALITVIMKEYDVIARIPENLIPLFGRLACQAVGHMSGASKPFCVGDRLGPINANEFATG